MVHRAGVVGSPIEHSLSPVLHTAAYAVLGLLDWTYSRQEVPGGRLAAHVARLDETWVGLSVTMPGKEEALALAVESGDEARLVGAANTLTRVPGGWRADNTDVLGLMWALREAGVPRPGRVDLIGSGATARSALVALQRLGAGPVRCVVRDRLRRETAALADTLGMQLEVVRYAEWPGSTARADLLLSTVPQGATPAVDAAAVAAGGVVFDVVYAPWPSPLASAAAAHGIRAIGGWNMLLHQAVEQVRLMTGLEAPVPAMRAALAGAVPEAADR
jgi:shikimate dehydrogenase